MDGAPYSLLKRWIGEGYLPNFENITKNGSFLPLTSTIPPLSSVAWATFSTGKNPAKHNIFGFVERENFSYKPYINFGKHLKSKTMWEILSENKKRCIVINVPLTYPPEEINGVMITGFLTPSIEKISMPKVVEELKKLNYKIDTEPFQMHNSKAKFLKDLGKVTERRFETFLYFMKKYEYDFFCGVFTGSDRIHHLLWEDMEEGGEFQDSILNYYIQLDEYLSRIYSELPKNTIFIMVSDHGSCLLKKEFYLNSWLKERDYLKFKRKNPKTVEDIEYSSKAFALDPGRIFINLKGREEHGVVERKDYENLREEIVESLLELEDPETGNKVIERVFKREEIYKGPFFEKAPDLVTHSFDHYDVKGSVKKENLFGRSHISGMHTLENGIFFINEKISKERVHIMDVAPTVFSLLKIPIKDLDGEPLVL
ncbi:MAG: alkaline phosphatase family protein [Candidatus Methanofastidiosia archaeon]